MFDFSSQSSSHANMAVELLLESSVPENDVPRSAEPEKPKIENMEQIVEDLRSVDGTKLHLLNVLYQYNNIVNYPIWAPMKYDGEFFTHD